MCPILTTEVGPEAAEDEVVVVVDEAGPVAGERVDGVGDNEVVVEIDAIEVVATLALAGGGLGLLVLVLG